MRKILASALLCLFFASTAHAWAPHKPIRDRASSIAMGKAVKSEAERQKTQYIMSFAPKDRQMARKMAERNPALYLKNPAKVLTTPR